jgi:RNA polymerase sigma-70 factor (ECF subfamily)
MTIVESTDLFERERRGLVAHSYRMLGSWEDAEDAVQEAYLRALRAWPAFEGRSSVRVWLYRIATNVCLNTLNGRARRLLPTPTDVLVDPQDTVVARESVRLAFIAGLQYLPGRQRAVLLLRDVLAFSAADAAEILGTSVPAVKSALQRARARLAEVDPARDALTEPTDRHARELLDQYMAAWERADPAALQRVLRRDATLEVLPSGDRAEGNAACLALAAPAMDAVGAWRMIPTSANGQPAAVAWWHGEPFGVAVLTVAADGITAVTVFADPDLPRRFGHRPDYAAASSRAPLPRRLTDG